MHSVVYYTDHKLPPDLAAMCLAQLERAAGNAEIVTVGLGAPVPLGLRITYPGERGILTMHKQILAGLTAARGGYVFLAEHDVMYHPSHFAFVPLRGDTFFYNVNVWHVRRPDGHAVYYDAQQVSGLCADRELLIDFYRQRIEQIERNGHNRHYEPGLKQSVGGQRVENWKSEYPNLDIRHGGNLTASKWSPADFRNRRYARGWAEADELPGWGRLADLFAVGV